jgi:tetratricopeptide (TPR) repeat protein
MISRRTVIIVFCLFSLIPSISCAQEGYYRIGKEQLEFRLAVKHIAKAKGERDWEDLTDLDNKHFFVSREVALDAGDVNGVFVAKPFDDVTYSITIYFKKEAWDKVHDITSHNIKKHLALVRHGKLFMAPVICEPVDSETDVVGKIDQATVEWFLKGFVRAKEPAEEKERRKKEEEKSKKELIEKIRKQPDDIDSQTELAGVYMFRTPRDYAKAAALLESVIKQDPQRNDILYLLADCYSSLREYKKAVKVLEQLLTVKPSKELPTRLQLADVYKKWGHYDNAIKELQKGMKILDSSFLPYKELLIKDTRNKMRELQLAASSPEAAS